MITSAPPLVFEFLKFNYAKFFSSKVFPINIPKPKPDFFSYLIQDFKYGSPIFDNISFGYPSPSSSIITSVNLLSLFKVINTFLNYIYLHYQ